MFCKHSATGHAYWVSTVEIGQDVVVHGDLIFEHAVKLKLHDTARVGEIIGDEVKMVGSS